MNLNYKNIQIDKELEGLLPPLSTDDYNALERSLVRNGFDEKFGRIKLWCPDGKNFNNNPMYIVDGHNRYKICKKHNIKLHNRCFEQMHFESKEEVIKWMYENQFARRNMSTVEKYKIAEKYTDILRELGKKNQSAGGKGLSNLTKVNSRKEKSKKVGISEGSYRKLDRVMKSDNDEIKSQLEKGDISIDKAFQMVSSNSKKERVLTPKQQIEKIDSRIKAIDEQMKVLKDEKETLFNRRNFLFEGLDIKYIVKYEFVPNDFWGRDCVFYVEYEGIKQELYRECAIHILDEPTKYKFDEVSKKYKNDLQMAWKKAHDEDVEYQELQKRQRQEQWEKAYQGISSTANVEEGDKPYFKEFFRVLVNKYHPDNGGDIEAMKRVNQLKQMWGL